MKFIPAFWSLYFFSKQGFFHVFFHVVRSMMFIGLIFLALFFVAFLILTGGFGNTLTYMFTTQIAHGVVILFLVYIILRCILRAIWSLIKSMF
jgi:hypothetical protein